MKTPLSLAILLLVTACAATPAPERTAQAETALAKALQGRTAGEARPCIALSDMGATRIIDRRTILFEGTGDTVWRNDLPQACAGLAPGRAIITRSTTAMLCSGDMVEVIEPVSMTAFGTCGLGRFTPYRKGE